MPYDLLAVGGTGQCVLLELLFRAERGEAGILPRNVWILDREVDTWKDAIARQTREIAPELRPNHEVTIARPAAPRNAPTQTMSMVLDGAFEPPPAHLPPLAARVFREGLTPPEWTQSIEQGFFALPRLAAAWFGTVGLDLEADFLSSAYLTVPAQGHEQPLFVAGSVAGGTGAGLLPSLLHALRLPLPALWRREVWFFPFLPYFNPQKGQRADGRIDLEQCRWNAGHAIQELEREQSLIRSRTLATIREEANRKKVPLTAISFIHPLVASLSELADVAPPDPLLIASRKSFDGSIGRGVDHILAVDAYRANPQRTIADASTHRIHIGVMQVPRAIDGDGGGSYAGGRRNAVVAEMTKVMHEELRATRDGATALPGVVAGRGLGETLDEVIRAQTLGRSTDRRARNADFWKRFDTRVEERRSRLAGPLEGLHVVQDPQEIFRLLDASWQDDEHRAKRLLAAVDANDDVAGTKVADRIIDAFLGVQEGQSRALLAGATHDRFSPADAGEAGQLATFAQVPVFGEFTASEEAASALAQRWRPADDPHALHGSSRAKLMGHAHAYASYVRNAVVGGGAPGIQAPIGAAWLLWKAAVAGLLTWEELKIEPSNPPERWHEAEEWASDFGGYLIAFSFHGVDIGFSSTDMGFVPAAQLGDHPLDADWKPNEEAAAALSALEESVRRIERERREQGRDSIAAILHDFVRLRATRKEIPWAKTLSFEGSDGAHPPGDVLRRNAIPAGRLWLRPEPGSPPVEMHIPLLVDDLAAIRRVAYGASSAGGTALLIISGNALQYLEGLSRLNVLTFAPPTAEGDRYVAAVVPENVRRASSALPAAPAADAVTDLRPLYRLDWE